MDDLNSLPLDENVKLNPKQKAMMQQYIGGSAPLQSSNNDDSLNKMKLVGYIVIIFLVIMNPLSQKLMEKVPYVGENSTMIFVFSIVTFLILVAIAVMF